VEKKIFITSDLHFNHNREFVYKPRGFNSVEEMNEAIVERWNAVVGPDDEVYVLGDLTLGDATIGVEYIRRLNGALHIVLGNHDTDNRVKMYYSLPNVVEVALAAKLNYKKYHFFMTHYPCLTGNLEKESLKQCTLNLYGHTHQKTNFYMDMPYMYHVGVDSHDCTPVLLDDIIVEMNDKVRECKEYL
jgi:calcineurin-like phosphoesterase family protein